MLLTLAVAALLQSPYDNDTYPLPSHTETVLREGLASHFRDAESARFRAFRGPRQGTFVGGVDTTPRTGQILCVQINAKNAYGAYIGFRDYVVVLSEEGRVYPTERMDRNLKNPWLVDAECKLSADQP